MKSVDLFIVIFMGMVIVEYLELVLSIVGLVSLIITIVRVLWVFCFSNIEWVSNYSIIELFNYDCEDRLPSGEIIDPEVIILNESEHMETFLVRPNDTIIKRLKIIKLDYDKDYKKTKKTIYKTIKNISPYHPLVVKTTIPEIFPRYGLRWTSDYGIKVEFIFYNNGKDGIIDSFGSVYKYGIWQKIRRIIGLK